MGDAAKGPGDEEICRHDLAHYGRAKTSALLVGTPFGCASPCDGFEPGAEKTTLELPFTIEE
jgi:hypothetical protein